MYAQIKENKGRHQAPTNFNLKLTHVKNKWTFVIDKINKTKQNLKMITHPTTWRPPMLLYLCSSLPERDTKQTIFQTLNSHSQQRHKIEGNTNTQQRKQ